MTSEPWQHAPEGHVVNSQEREIISGIFQRLEQAANQPRDPEVERFIEHVRSLARPSKAAKSARDMRSLAYKRKMWVTVSPEGATQRAAFHIRPYV